MALGAGTGLQGCYLQAARKRAIGGLADQLLSRPLLIDY
jgi:hypothetical protein